MSKVALITGITGQDGSYLAELLLEKAGMRYMVSSVDTVQSLQTASTIWWRMRFPKDRFFLHFGDLTDSSNLAMLIMKIKPEEASI